MVPFFLKLFSSDFMPHGMCYLWDPSVLWLNVISDAAIALSYYALPILLFAFAGKRKDLSFQWIFLAFGGFILACGTSHVLAVWTVWHGTYRLDGVVKAVTAMISITTTVLLVPLIPSLVQIPSLSSLTSANKTLSDEVLKGAEMAQALDRQAGLLDLAHDAILVRQLDGTLTFWNRGAERLYGWRADQAIGTRSHELLDTVFPAPLSEIARQLQATGLWEGQLEHHTSTGEVVIVSSRWAIRRNDDDGLEVLEINRDITAQKAAEDEARRNAEIPYRLFFENNPLPGWLYSLDNHRFLAVNDSAIHHYGYTRDEFLLLSLPDIQPGQSGSTPAPPRPAGENFSPSVTHRKKDGSPITVEVSSRPVEGPVPLEFVLIRDITDRVRAEEQARAASERLTLALQASLTGVWDLDELTQNVSLDAFASDLLGIAPGHRSGLAETFRANVVPEDPSLLGGPESSLNPAHPEFKFEFRIQRPDRTIRHVQSHGKARFSESGQLLSRTGVVRDITEQRELAQRVLQSSKMEAVGQLAAGVAHDFNNLLTVILGYTKLLLSNCPELRRPKLQEILQAAEEAAALTHQLLAFSRKQVLQPSVVSLAATVESMERMVRRLIGEDIEIATIIDPELGRVKVDPHQFQQVILNLVVNSRDAMPRGGKLTLELKNQDVDEVLWRRHGAAPGRYIMFAVSDTGCGMSPEVRERVFEPFFTTKDPGRGTGLGLATVYGIVKQSGGYIWLYSEPGMGTTFRIYLPRIGEQTPQLEAAPKNDHSGNETILVVEDEQGVRLLIREILGAEGYTVLLASEGKEAMLIAESHAHAIDLVLTDVVMKEMNGKIVAKKLTERRPGIKVLFMSGYTGDAIVNHGILDPSVAFIPKPFTPDDLCSKVRETLDLAAPSLIF